MLEPIGYNTVPAAAPHEWERYQHAGLPLKEGEIMKWDYRIGNACDAEHAAQLRVQAVKDLRSMLGDAEYNDLLERAEERLRIATLDRRNAWVLKGVVDGDKVVSDKDWEAALRYANAQRIALCDELSEDEIPH